MRVLQEPACVLHTTPYRETSLLVEIFTRQYGRIGMVARGARRPKSGLRAVLVPFQPLLLAWSGSGELVTLNAAEAVDEPLALSGDALLCGFYVNELVFRLLHRHDPHEALYDRYLQSLRALRKGDVLPAVLRLFEKHLLQELGYGLVLEHAADGHSPLAPEVIYDYLPERGPMVAQGVEGTGVQVHGETLLALAAERLVDPRTLQECKILMRACLAPHLGDRPLHSRKLFRSVKSHARSTEEEVGGSD
jgi:DNA repair protein RecO (recombination protein O)